jgi:predicted unusual protein kinase regulating ubiquinone biosynthesis (AarF/ABC1/UbiB family)
VDIGSPILGWYISRKFDNITARYRSPEENQRRLEERATDLKNCICQGQSVTLIKSGQALSLRQDIVKSPEYVRALTKLQDEVGTFSNQVAMDIISDDLGMPACDIFDFEPADPIASASIGQVYKAKIRATGESVAVKVQRPNAPASASLDMYILRTFAKVIKKRRNLRSDLVAIADEFGCQLYNELNYRKEAENCMKFNELYGDVPNIAIPGVYQNLTSSRVLTMEFIEGEKGPWIEEGERLLTVGIQCSVLQLLDSGFFHADPHRGNLLKTPDGKLGYLDFGMMAEVPEYRRYALMGTVLGLVNKDLSLVISSLKDLDFLPDGTNTTDVVDSLSFAISQSTVGGSGSSLNFTKLNQNLEGMSTKLPFRLPPFYSLIVRSLTILEGLALNVDPNFRLIKGAFPFVAKQILTSDNPELDKLVRAVIVDPEEGRIRWNRLEQLLSIVNNANKALDGDFSALQDAQERSDVRKSYIEGGMTEGPASDLTADVILVCADYLLSDRGAVLREPLIEEIVDTIDSLGLAAMTVASITSNGVVGMPEERAEQVKVERFFRLLSTMLEAAGRQGGDGLSNSRASTLRGVVKLVTSNLNANRLKEYAPVIEKLGLLLRQLVARLVERSTRRTIQATISPEAVKSFLRLLPK